MDFEGKEGDSDGLIGEGGTGRLGGSGHRLMLMLSSKLTVISEETSRHRTRTLGPRRARAAGRTCRRRFPRRGCGGHEELWREQTAQKVHGKMRDDARCQAVHKGPHGREEHAD